MVHARREGLAVAAAEAHVQHGRAVLKGPDQARRGRVAVFVDLVEVHIFVPGGREESRRGLGREDDARDGVVGRLRYFELCS